MLQQTDKALDVAIDGTGSFKIDLSNDDVRYTCDGTFRTDVSGDGYLVDAGITHSSIRIGTDRSVAGIQSGIKRCQLPASSAAVVRLPEAVRVEQRGRQFVRDYPIIRSRSP